MHQTAFVGQAHFKTYMKHLRVTTSQKSKWMFWTKLRAIIPAKGLQESGQWLFFLTLQTNGGQIVPRELAVYVNYEDGRLHRLIPSEGKTIFYRSLRLWRKSRN